MLIPIRLISSYSLRIGDLNDIDKQFLNNPVFPIDCEYLVASWSSVWLLPCFNSISIYIIQVLFWTMSIKSESINIGYF